MNPVLRAKLLALSGVLALGGVATAAPAVHAAPLPQIYPLGGPAQMTMEDNGGLTPGHVVRLEVWKPDWSAQVAPFDSLVSVCGNISTQPQLCSGPNYPKIDVNNYVGGVIVTAYDKAGSSEPAPVTSQVYPASTISAYRLPWRAKLRPKLLCLRKWEQLPGDNWRVCRGAAE
jgi:hypothetical protein